MKYTKELFHETVDILVQAYLNGTLQHSNCYACAVGNIVAARNNRTYTTAYDIATRLPRKIFFNNKIEWYNAFTTCNGIQFRSFEFYPMSHKVIKEIESTGYEIHDLAKIEFAFETAPGRCEDINDETWMFNGLMAVVDVLCEIHGMNDTEKQESKLLFVK